MKQEPGSRGEYREKVPQQIITAAPGVELLLDIEHAENYWPPEIAKDEKFLEQVESRRELNQKLDVVTSALPRPDITLEQAVADGQLTEEQVADLYESLSDLLAPESEYQRILLYLPFEFLPNTNWKPTSEHLKTAAQTFRSNYLSAWEQQLAIHDVRANFIDGDVLEFEKREGDLPRVVKAAHLIPKLVEAGMMTVEEVKQRMNETEDEVLRASIADTLPLLTPVIPGEASSAGRVEGSRTALNKIESELEESFDAIEKVDFGDVTPNRDKWLRQEEKRKAIVKASDQIRDAIKSGTLEEFDLETLGASAKQAFVEGVRKASEANPDLFETYRDQIESLWNSNESSIRESLSKLFFRLHGLGVVNDEQLRAHGLTMPALGGPFSENLKDMQAEVAEIQKTVAAIERDPQLSKTVFPVVLVFGSRLKGYGTKESDIDVAVFVKPGVEESQKDAMRARLKELFTHEKIDSSIKEFWLEKDGSSLRVMDKETSEVRELGSYWTYVLFGAVWEGSEKAVAELRAKVLTPYFYDDGKELYGRNARGLGIEELERDILQYRLMHKGYERFYPSYGGMNVPHADSIDGRSTFWDSGYRQLATKLYASRVFLPKLEQ